jgi:hypothetical protein
MAASLGAMLARYTDFHTPFEKVAAPSCIVPEYCERNHRKSVRTASARRETVRRNCRNVDGMELTGAQSHPPVHPIHRASHAMLDLNFNEMSFFPLCNQPPCDEGFGCKSSAHLRVAINQPSQIVQGVEALMFDKHRDYGRPRE